jgi:LmbE family N-acetylglucosaminyl deacetylase
MADLDDEPDQVPLPIEQVQETIARLLAETSYSLILTHGPKGEYTQHRRHDECSNAVVELWQSGSIDTERLWLFAFEDGGRAYLPLVRDDADRRDILAENVWLEKRRLITDVYGYGIDSWEARTGALTQHRQQQSAQYPRSNNRESTRIERISGAGGRLGPAR